MAFTVFHNPNCGTSRNTIALLQEHGIEPTVVEYLKTGWTMPQLKALLAKGGLTARDILRVRGTPAEDLGLTNPATADEVILEAMTNHPILVERPIVESDTRVVLARPKERVLELVDPS